jgi:hypothetical protein
VLRQTVCFGLTLTVTSSSTRNQSIMGLRLFENLGRSPKVDLYVFDFDDTLAETGNLVFVVPAGLYSMPESPKPEDIITELQSDEFLFYDLAPGEAFNFSDFNHIRSAEPISHMVELLMEKTSDPQAIVYILTARSSAAEESIDAYLDSIAKSMGYGGINIPARNIVGLGSSSPADKASKIKHWIVKEHPRSLHYYDDSIKNLLEFEAQFEDLMDYAYSDDASPLTRAAINGVRGRVFVSHPEGTPREVSLP